MTNAKAMFNRAMSLSSKWPIYLVAGEPNRADRAFLKATGPAGADTLRGFAQSRDEARAQFQKIKEAFYHRP